MAEKILVTGAAGFIGFHVSKRLLDGGSKVVGLDNLNDYYSVELKKSRVRLLEQEQNFQFLFANLADRDRIAKLFEDERFDRVVNLAAQAGVRYSLENPHQYVESNLTGFVNLLEGCRHHDVKHLVFASSSSVYGSNLPPWSVEDHVDHPLSLYAATKKSNELIAHAYGHLFGVPATGLRFFTVYGPWGRPDSAYFLFTDAIHRGQQIKVFNEGKMERDFTFVDDIVDGVEKVIFSEPKRYEGTGDPGPGRSATAPFRVYNIGSDRPVGLLRFIEVIEDLLGKKADKLMMPMQLGDITSSHADVSALEREFGFRPTTKIEDGLKAFVDWYLQYHASS